MDYEVELPVYEGPLDLLLSLVMKNKIDIHDIPIHVITDQYLAYLHEAQACNLELASSFFTMAAQLLLIKSRMLLPKRRQLEEDEGEDPREELSRSLEQFKKMKEIRARIEELLTEEAPYHGKEPEEVKSGLYEGSISPARLRAAFRLLYEERKEEEERFVEAEEVSLEEETGKWRALLYGGRPVPFAACFRRQRTRLHLVVSFMALLELIRLGEVRVRDSAGGLVIEGRNTGNPPAGSAH